MHETIGVWNKHLIWNKIYVGKRNTLVTNGTWQMDYATTRNAATLVKKAQPRFIMVDKSIQEMSTVARTKTIAINLIDCLGAVERSLG